MSQQSMPQDFFSVPQSSLGTDVEDLPDSDYDLSQQAYPSNADQQQMPFMPDVSSPEQPEDVDIRNTNIVPRHIQAYAPPTSPQLQRPMGFTGQPRSYSLGAAPSGAIAVGVPLVLAGAGTVAGGMYAGAYGAGAGLLLTGAAINAYRFATENDEERKTHGAFAAIAAIAGGYLAYRAYQKKEGVK